MCSLFIHRCFLSLPGVSFSSPGRTPAAQKTSEDPATFTLNPFPLILAGFFKKLYNPWVCAVFCSSWGSVSSQREGPHCSNYISFEFQEKFLDILVVFSFTVISTHIKLYALHFNEVVSVLERLDGSVSWVSSWFPFKSWSQGRVIRPCVGLHTPSMESASDSLSLSPPRNPPQNPNQNKKSKNMSTEPLLWPAPSCHFFAHPQ